jgi:hypothetical protein
MRQGPGETAQADDPPQPGPAASAWSSYANSQAVQYPATVWAGPSADDRGKGPNLNGYRVAHFPAAVPQLLVAVSDACGGGWLSAEVSCLGARLPA